jgi:HPt (histidine-containing phosphotransfer) domain-containing protein
MANQVYINPEEGLARVAGNEMLFRKLLGKFSASVNVEEFKTLLLAQDYVSAGEIVHAAKGIAGNLSLTAFYENSVILMEQLRGGGKPAQENVDLFISLYDETTEAIEDYLG